MEGISCPTSTPDEISMISWNLDGLDSRNLKERTDAVIYLIEKGEYDIIFFQELVHSSFETIFKKLASKYTVVTGTKTTRDNYYTGTLLRKGRVNYKGHEIVPFPDSVMQRNVLITEATCGEAKMYLLNTHLESHVERFDPERIAQLKKCFEKMLSIPNDCNAIFSGDLNVYDEEVTNNVPKEVSDLWIKFGSDESCRFTWDMVENTNRQFPESEYPLQKRLDRFYFREANPPTMTPKCFRLTGQDKVDGTQSFPSDHWAIVTSFRLSTDKDAKTQMEGVSNSIPSEISMISWNLDGLDRTNLKERTDAVIHMIEKDEFDIIFFQELRPTPFETISEKLTSKYTVIPGSKQTNKSYYTGTFLRKGRVNYRSHDIVSFPNSVMQRNILVTKATCGEAKMYLLNTHLESHVERFDPERIAQLKKCFEMMLSFPKDCNVILTGDFNVYDEEVINIVPKEVSDLWIKFGSDDSCRFTWDLVENTNRQFPESEYPLQKRLDRFYFRESNPPTMEPKFFRLTGQDKVEATQSFPSEHWAIIVSLRCTTLKEATY